MNYWNAFNGFFKRRTPRITGYKLSNRSRDNLKGVHPDLVAVVLYCMYKQARYDFAVIDGLRSQARQLKYLEQGNSLTKNSRHLKQPDGFSHAVDILIFVNGEETWEEEYYIELSEDMKQSAKELNVAIEWGGDWKNFFDGGHYEI